LQPAARSNEDKKSAGKIRTLNDLTRKGSAGCVRILVLDVAARRIIAIFSLTGPERVCRRGAGTCALMSSELLENPLSLDMTPEEKRREVV
jgi:hypothetical protein